MVLSFDELYWPPIFVCGHHRWPIFVSEEPLLIYTVSLDLMNQLGNTHRCHLDFIARIANCQGS